MPNLVSCSAWILLALLPVSAPVAPSAPATAPASMHAGPVYTAAPENAEPSAYPKFPEVQVQVELPPGTSPDLILPDALRLAIDGRHAATATRVQTLASTGYGLTASLSLDVSGSMRGGPLKAVRAGLTKFVNDAGPHDKVAIQTIADDSQWDVDWNDPHEKVQMALDRLATRGRLTRLWDGLLIAIDHLPRAPLARRLILISDGHDEGSLHSEEQVIAAATAGGIPIDAIGVTRSDPKYLQALQRLAAETGGQFRAAKDTSELQDFVGSGITRLKSTPVVDFTLARNLGDGAKHHFDVTWTHSGNASMAETAAVLPRVSRFSQERGLWLGSSAVILLAGIVLIAMAAGKKKPVILPQPAMQLAIAAPAPQPLAAAPPSREPAVPTSPAADRPLPRAFTPPIATSSSDKERAKTLVGARYAQPREGRPAAWLLCEAGFAQGRRFAIDQAEYWIGALEGNHLQIPDDPTVSRNHACLVFDHDVLGIHDYHSTNGSWVNGELIQDERRLLHFGDRIQIGQSVFLLRDE